MNCRDEAELRGELAKLRSKLACAQRDMRRYSRQIAQLTDILESNGQLPIGWSTLTTWSLEAAITASNVTAKAAEVVHELPASSRRNALAWTAGHLSSLGHSGSFVASVGDLVLPLVPLVETLDQRCRPVADCCTRGGSCR
jgi:hypothetical protein